MDAQPRPGMPYHLQLTRSGAGWRLAVVVLLSAFGLIVLSALALGVVYVGARLVGFDDFTIALEDGINAGEILATNVGLALLTLLAALLVRALYGSRLSWLSSNRPGLRWRWLLVCVGVALVVHSLFLVLGTAGAVVERESPFDAAVLGFLGVVLVTTPLQAAGEEYLFRGALLQALGAARIPLWGVYLLSGLLFAVAHLQFDPFLVADRFLLGVAFAYLAVETGGLEAPIAIHAVKNVAVLIPAGLLDETESALDPADVTWVPVAIDLVLLAVAVPWVLWLSRRRHGRRGEVHAAGSMPPSEWGRPPRGSAPWPPPAPHLQGRQPSPPLPPHLQGRQPSPPLPPPAGSPPPWTGPPYGAPRPPQPPPPVPPQPPPPLPPRRPAAPERRSRGVPGRGSDPPSEAED